MSPLIALVLSLPFIVWLWHRDVAERGKISRAAWLPLIVLLTLSSHPLSFWLGLGGDSGGDLEGNSFDRTFLLILTFLSLGVLSKRGFNWGIFIAQNKAICALYCFLLITIFWADFPLVLFKRWFKDFSSVFFALVLLTESNPLQAIKALAARCSYVLFPLSVVCIKYFPAIGRAYSRGGLVSYQGVAGQKNGLGEIVLVFGLILFTQLSKKHWPERSFLKNGRLAVLISSIVGIYLLLMSDSKTALVCLLLGSVILFCDRIPWLKQSRKRVVFIFVVVIPILYLADGMFHLSDIALDLLNRSRTLTGRTDVWAAIKENPVNPLIGAGYMMYFDKLDKAGITIFNLNTAHNGYLESYLDGGIIGVIVLAMVLLALGFKQVRAFLSGSEVGKLKFAFWVVAIFYNISESSFTRRSPLWFAFILFAIDWSFIGGPPARTSEVEVREHEDLRQHEPAAAW